MLGLKLTHSAQILRHTYIYRATMSNKHKVAVHIHYIVLHTLFLNYLQLRPVIAGPS